MLDESERNMGIFSPMMKRQFTRIISEGHVINGISVKWSIWTGEQLSTSNSENWKRTSFTTQTVKKGLSSDENSQKMSVKISFMVPLMYDVLLQYAICISVSQWLLFIIGSITNKTGCCLWPSPHPGVKMLSGNVFTHISQGVLWFGFSLGCDGMDSDF